jgi:cytochrome P450 / NADPH-cytochrome P450 reductase
LKRLKILKPAYRHDDERFESNIELMNSIADTLIAERKRGGEAAKRNDLLQKMLDGRDPVTKEGLSDLNIRYNMLTFLIAGYVSFRLRT